MEELQLNFLLMGKTGHGKSATGNTILGRRGFKTSNNVTSETKDVELGYAEFGNLTLQVVDGPGLEDTDLDKVNDKTAAVKNLNTALVMCNGGVDAFLLVIKFGGRCTQEDKDTLDALQRIFGDGFINHVIVVVTGGDNFEYEMNEDGKPDKSLHDWCSEQTDPVFMKLYKDCEGRFVLFNNRETDEEKKLAQIQEVVQLAQDLQKHFGRYTNESFKAAKRAREKMILELKAPQLKEEFQQKMCFLIREIERLSERSSNEAKEKVRARVHDLRREINQHDQGLGVLRELKKLMTEVEESLDDKNTLIALGKQLEEVRKSKSLWGIIGALGTAVGTFVSGVGSVGAVLIAGGAVIAGTVFGAVAIPVCAGVHYTRKRAEEKEIERKQEEIRNKHKS